MVPAEEKCLCQICTCGKHKCRHCTDPPYDVHSDRLLVDSSEYRSQFMGFDNEQPRSAKRKQWEKSPEQMKKIYKSYPTIKEDKENRSSVASSSVVQSPIPSSTRAESFEVRSDTTSEVATDADDSRYNRDPLRNKPINTMPHDPLKEMTTEELLAQIARPIPVKPMDNLKSGGTMDLVTTHQHDFTEKTAERPLPKRPHTAMKSSLYTEYLDGYSDYNGAMKIPPKSSDSSMVSTDLIKGHSDVSYAASDATTFDRSGFETSTITSHEGQDIKKDDHVITAKPSEDFRADNLQAFSKTHERKKWDQSSLYRDTTLRHDFKPIWEYSRPPLKKPKDSLRNEGLMDLQTTMRTQFTEKAVGRVKPNQWRPKTSFKFEGEFDGRTVNSESYKGFTVERVPLHRPPAPTLPNMGSFQSETTTGSDYRGWMVSRSLAEQKDASNERSKMARSYPLLPSLGTDAKDSQYNSHKRSESMLAHDRLLQSQSHLDGKQMHDFHGWATNGTSPYRTDTVYNGVDTMAKTSKTMMYSEKPEKLSTAKPGYEQQKKMETVFKEALEVQDPSSRAIYIGPPTLENKAQVEESSAIKAEKVDIQKEKHVTSSPKGVPSGKVKTEDGDAKKSASEHVKDHLQESGESQKIKGSAEAGTAVKVRVDDKSISDQSQHIKVVKATDVPSSAISASVNKVSERQASAEEKTEHASERAPSSFRASAKRDSKPEIELETTSKTHFQRWEIERPVPIKHEDNLKQSGAMEFQTTNTAEFSNKGIGEKLEQIRYHDNIKQEGEMKFETTNAVMFAERRPNTRPVQVKHADNIKQEGEMVFSTTSTEMFGEKKLEERPKPVKHQDNIKQEGAMELLTSNVVDFSAPKPDARPEQVKYKDNLKQEGIMEMVTTNSVEFSPKILDGRLEKVLYKDNLVQEGELELTTTNREAFVERQLDARPVQIRHKDNLKQEGGMEMTTTTSTEFKERPLDARPQPIRQKDNIKQEGSMQMITTNVVEFPQRPLDARPEPIRQKDNIKQEGEMQMVTTTKTEFKELSLDGRPQPIRQKDNLKQEGGMQMETTNIAEFPQRSLDARPQPIRQKDNLKQEGDMQMITTNVVEFPERPTDARPHLIKQKDNIKQEGDMQMVTTNIVEFPERPLDARPAQIRHKDNIKSEGAMELTTTTKTEFEARKLDARPEPIRQKDNLKLEGSMEMVTSNALEFPDRRLDDRPQPVLKQDHIKQEGTMEFQTTTRSEFVERHYDGKPNPIRHKDHIKQEGEMELLTTNRMEFAEKKGEGKLQSIRQKDNLTLEKGVMAMQTTTASAFPERHLDSRPKPVKYKDNLISEGGMELVTSNKVEFPDRKIQVKPSPVKYKDNITLEGPMVLETTTAAEFKERKDVDRTVQIKHSDHLKQEGKMELYTTNAVMFPERKLEDRPKPVKHKDNIKNEGKMELHTTNEEMFQQIKTIERPKPVRYSDNLKYSGVLFSTKKSGSTKIRSEKMKRDVKLSSSKVASETIAKDTNATGEIQTKKTEIVKSEDSSSDMKSDISKQAVMKDDSQRAIQVIPKPSSESTAIASVQEQAKSSEKLVAQTEKQESTVLPQAIPSTETLVKPQKTEQRTDDIKQVLKSNDIDSILGQDKKQVVFDQSNKYFGISDGTSSQKSRQMQANQHSWTVVKPTTPVKRQDNLQLRGTMDFKTTNQAAYHGHYTPKISRAKRPQSSLKLFANGDLGDNRFSVQSEKRHRVVSKSQSNLPTTVSPARNLKRDAHIKFTGEMDFNTTHRTSYNGLQTSRSESNLHTISERAKEPVASNKQLMRSTSHGLFGNPQEPFSGTTTYRCSFAAATPGGGGGAGRGHCPASEIEKGTSKFEFRKEVNGHKYYLPLVES